MIVVRDFTTFYKKEEVFLTIGFFDGIHIGHQKIIGEVVKRAKTKNAKSCVVTFDKHPSELFSGEKVKFLTCWEEKKEILNSLGVDIVQLFTFDAEFSRLSPGSFLEKISCLFRIKEIIVGEEFTFGFRREGNVDFLRKNQKKFGYRLEAIPPVKLDGKKVGSSLLREFLREGKIKEVIRGLGRPPTVIGRVIKGKGRGKKIGFPTANLEPPPEKLLPESGVYAGYVEFDGERCKALLNIGAKPTFGDFEPSVEVHIMDFNGELYGKIIKVHLLERIRKILDFSSPFCLSLQIKKDKEKAEKILEEYFKVCR